MEHLSCRSVLESIAAACGRGLPSTSASAAVFGEQPNILDFGERVTASTSPGEANRRPDLSNLRYAAPADPPLQDQPLKTRGLDQREVAGLVVVALGLAGVVGW